MTHHLTTMHEAAAEANTLLLRWQLIRVRLRNGLTVATVADRMGMTPEEVIYQMEEPGSNPRLSVVRRYALAVGALIGHEVIPERIAEPEPAAPTTEETDHA